MSARDVLFADVAAIGNLATPDDFRHVFVGYVDAAACLSVRIPEPERREIVQNLLANFASLTSQAFDQLQSDEQLLALADHWVETSIGLIKATQKLDAATANGVIEALDKLHFSTTYLQVPDDRVPVRWYNHGAYLKRRAREISAAGQSVEPHSDQGGGATFKDPLAIEKAFESRLHEAASASDAVAIENILNEAVAAERARPGLPWYWMDFAIPRWIGMMSGDSQGRARDLFGAWAYWQESELGWKHNVDAYGGALAIDPPPPAAPLEGFPRAATRTGAKYTAIDALAGSLAPPDLTAEAVSRTIVTALALAEQPSDVVTVAAVACIEVVRRGAAAEPVAATVISAGSDDTLDRRLRQSGATTLLAAITRMVASVPELETPLAASLSIAATPTTMLEAMKADRMLGSEIRRLEGRGQSGHSTSELGV